MKSVMLSIKPKYCELIASGRKTIEVRKTKPKIDTPFKVYIYMTKSNLVGDRKAYQDRLAGKVIGEFVCDEIQTFRPDDYNCPYDISDDDLKLTCLNREDMYAYGRGKTLYGWHISNLVIYDKPKELSKFINKSSQITFDKDGVLVYKGMTRPPQSWCYVEDC